MKYVCLGRSGLKVNRLCLGTMNFGPLASETESFAIMDRSVELGINFFDTADVYGWEMGKGITEQILGKWFSQGEGQQVLSQILDQDEKHLMDGLHYTTRA
jgi:aryl-alcohol dehydrogenase-like predicted oxidoreductase